MNNSIRKNDIGLLFIYDLKIIEEIKKLLEEIINIESKLDKPIELHKLCTKTLNKFPNSSENFIETIIFLNKKNDSVSKKTVLWYNENNASLINLMKNKIYDPLDSVIPDYCRDKNGNFIFKKCKKWANGLKKSLHKFSHLYSIINDFYIDFIRRMNDFIKDLDIKKVNLI